MHAARLQRYWSHFTGPKSFLGKRYQALRLLVWQSCTGGGFCRGLADRCIWGLSGSDVTSYAERATPRIGFAHHH